MDASAILAALQWGATAIAEGILSEAGKNIYKSLRKEVEAIIPSGDIDGIQASQDAQKSERVLVQGAATASQAAQRHLDTLAYEILALREKHKIAQRDTKVDVIVERVFELFERHSIDRPTMAEILGVSLSTLKGHGLVDHIDNKKLDALAEMFAVARGWLLGNSDSLAICVCRWHVREDPVHRLLRFAIAGKEPKIHFVKSKRFTTEKVIREEAPISFSKIQPTSNIAIVTEVKHQTSSRRSYVSYERWESVPWDRDLDRNQLLTLVMFCERIPNTPRGIPDLNGSAKEIESRLKRKIFIYGYKFHSNSAQIDNELLMEYERGVVPPRELVSHQGRSAWFIEDYVDLPEWSGVAKADPGEYKNMLERYERMLVSLSWDREFKELLSSD